MDSLDVAANLREAIERALAAIGLERLPVTLEHPADFGHGDYSTNVALVAAKQAKMPPRALADKLLAALQKERFPEVEKMETAPPGFINFYLKPEYFVTCIADILAEPEAFGKNGILSGKKVMVEYTDPNPFKEFHIGHLMSNSIGESIANLFEWSGASVIRACWQGDVGLHVAKALWGMLRDEKAFPKDDAALADKVAFLGRSYVAGARAYEDSPESKKEIDELNKKIFMRSDPLIQSFYEKGRAWSLAHFEEIYAVLGTKFDHYFFESVEGRNGEAIVSAFLKKGVFEKSDGAVVFHGEKYGLHTRVFITSQGLPTYEAKELGLNEAKFKVAPSLTESIIITANEQDDYFKVILKAMEQVFPEIAKKTKHISHGMMRFASGKISSRTGNVITGESLIGAMRNLVFEKIKERELPADIKQHIADIVAVGAIKYSILRQGIGSDIIYDFEKSISFEGDSGPYLQYAYTRAMSVVAKAAQEKIPAFGLRETGEIKIGVVERMLARFPEVVSRAMDEFAPHFITTYLTELASAFNSYYAAETIVDAKDPRSPYKVALAAAFAAVMKNGLHILGIAAPSKM